MGVRISQPCALNTASVVLRRHDSSVGTVRHGAMAPSATLRLRSGMSRAGSNSLRTPSPVHAGQAPWGELKEKLRGSSSSMVVPSMGQL